jgi:hypothetical protein
MSTRAGEPSVGMIPRITGGLDSTGCSDHRTSLAENSGATCCPRTIGPAQREHTIGGKLLGGFVCLRRTPWAEVFGVGSDIYGGPRWMQGKAPTDLKKMVTETNHAEVNRFCCSQPERRSQACFTLASGDDPIVFVGGRPQIRCRLPSHKLRSRHRSTLLWQPEPQVQCRALCHPLKPRS